MILNAIKDIVTIESVLSSPRWEKGGPYSHNVQLAARIYSAVPAYEQILSAQMARWFQIGNDSNQRRVNAQYAKVDISV